MTAAEADPTPPAHPTLSRRHASGAESARGLLFTVLGEFVLPGGGSGWTSAFIDVLGRLGVEEKATRQALIRTAADGWLRSERVGRRSRWHLTANAERLLVDGTERIFRFRPTQRNWDGRWLVVHVRAPESERAARHRLRTRLTWAGLGSPTPGVWIGTHASVERIREVEDVVADAGLAEAAQVFTARHRAGCLPAMVREAWDLASLAEGYSQFLADFGPPRGGDVLARTIELVHAWRRFPWTDPTLPRELLPSRWSGDEAATLFAARHAEWAAPARGEWQTLNSASG